MTDYEKWRRYKIQARYIAAQIPADHLNFVRAGGDVVCPICGLKLFDHPECKADQLRIGCDGNQYKL